MPCPSHGYDGARASDVNLGICADGGAGGEDADAFPGKKTTEAPCPAADPPRSTTSRFSERGFAVKVWGVSKTAANYQPALRPEVCCGRCKYMFPRLTFGGCRLVRGLIKNSATCEEFTPRRSSR